MNPEFIYRKFREYYSRVEVPAPPRIEQREFGVGLDKKIDSRHLRFESADRLNFYLRSAVPLYISCSAAFYEFPDARPMPNKNWLGSDLVFDLDADECGIVCDHPAGEVCGNCMRQVAIETSRLVKGFLKPDFGFTDEELKIVFSGNRGFHVHVRSDKVADLDQSGRKEILDYLTAEKISLLRPGKGRQLLGPTPDSPGWGGRIALALYVAVKSYKDVKEFRERGIASTGVKPLLKNREASLEAIKTGVWSKAGLGVNAWNDLVRDMAMKLHVKLDKNVTMDTSRLLRVPGTLHGGTGLVARPVHDLDSFDPFSDPVAFGDEPVSVMPKKNHSFQLKRKEFVLEEGRQAELPEYAAVYAACRDWVNVND